MKANFFDGPELVRYFRSLPTTKTMEPLTAVVGEKIAIMTHDDGFDAEMHDYGVEHGCPPTFFVLHERARRRVPADAQVEFHYNKESRLDLREQTEAFANWVGRVPRLNRNHRLWWRADHLDLAHLAMHGFALDSTRLGVGAFRLRVEQREIPIWELPFAICDPPAVSVAAAPTATANMAADWRDLFKRGLTPLVALFHPYLKERTKWRDFYALSARYGYRVMTVQQFHDTVLVAQSSRTRR
jgi:hypothetical protein